MSAAVTYADDRRRLLRAFSFVKAPLFAVNLLSFSKAPLQIASRLVFEEQCACAFTPPTKNVWVKPILSRVVVGAPSYKIIHDIHPYLNFGAPSNVSRQLEVTIHRLRFGVAFTKKYLNKIGMVYTPN